MTIRSVTVHDFAGLAGVRGAYLAAVDGGDEELVIELPPVCFGVGPAEALGSLELAAVNTTSPPSLDVTLRCDGLCVFAGIPVTISARRVAIEGLAVVGCHSSALGLTVSAGARLSRVVALGSVASENERAVVDISSAGSDGSALTVESTVIGRSKAPDALLGLYSLAGSWFDTVELDTATIAGGSADAALAIDAARSVRLRNSLLGAGPARALVRLTWPVADAEISACGLSASGPVLELQNRPPSGEPAPVRLTAGTRVTADTATLPSPLEADASVVQASVAALDESIDEALGRASREVLELDSRLEHTLSA